MNIGITHEQASTLREKFGFNEIKYNNKKPLIVIFLKQFNNSLIIILILAAILSAFHDLTESLVIGFIVLLNGLVGFVQEFKTDKTIEALGKMISPKVRVLRAGEESMLETRLLVPSDIVILGEGDKIPADGILLESRSIRIEESALTGESVPVEKSTADKVFMGSSLVRGSGIMEVQKIGQETSFGEIARLTTMTKKTKSPIEKELSSIGIFVAKMTAIICLVLIIVHVLRNLSTGSPLFTLVVEAFTFAVSVAIAAVPEGLATTITVALAIGASVLAKKKAIIKKLSSTETLGTVSTICTDKTGTLTKNQMTVRSITSSSGQKIHLSGTGYDPREGSIISKPSNSEELLRIADIVYYCNEASLRDTHSELNPLGDPTEISLLTMSEKIYKSLRTSKSSYIKELIFPFDSQRKLMSVVATDSYERSFVFVKGSPDHVLKKCSHYWDGNSTKIITETYLKNIKKEYDNLARQALRVLAVAYRKVELHPEEMDSAESELVFAGLIGMIDPPREEVKEAISQCKSAGIRTIVITGDYGITAGVIAEELGIVEADNYRVITGDDLKEISETELEDILTDKEKGVIFARTLPAQKMRIVEALQQHGEIVAMTGDGVNDAPALKRADIGVAMGITGTEVSKEASTLILLDDSFSTIVEAVKEGRRIYNNLKKFVLYTLSSNIGELVVIFISILSGMPLILTAILILLINLGTDILPAIALGVDPAEEGIMHQAPRDPQSRVLSKAFIKRLFMIGIIIGISVTVAFIYTLIRDGWVWGTTFSETTLQHGQTLAFSTLVIVQLMNSFSVKSHKPISIKKIFSNTFHIVAVLVSLGIVLLVNYLPSLNKLLKTSPLDIHDWFVVFIASLVPIIIFEMSKKYFYPQN